MCAREEYQRAEASGRSARLAIDSPKRREIVPMLFGPGDGGGKGDFMWRLWQRCFFKQTNDLPIRGTFTQDRGTWPRCFSVCCFFKHDRTQTLRQADGLLYPSGAFPPLRVGWQENQSRTNSTKTTDTVSIIIFSFLMALSHDTFLCKILKCLSFLDVQTSLAPTPLSLLVRQTSDFHSVSVSEPS